MSRIEKLNDLIASKVYQAHKITSETLEEIRQAVLDPTDRRDVIDEDEKGVLAKLYDDVQKNRIDVTDESGSPVVGREKDEVTFQLANLANTVTFKGTRSFWYGKWFNPDWLMVDLSGVTFLQPTWTGRDERTFFPLQGIESANAATGIFLDCVTVKTSGEHEAFTFYVPDETEMAGTVVDLINQRVHSAGSGSGQTTIPSVQGEGSFQTRTVPGTDRTYDLYTSPAGAVAIYPVSAFQLEKEE